RAGALRPPGRGRRERLPHDPTGRVDPEHDAAARGQGLKMKHTLVALLEDKPGVLNRVVNMFSRRAFNIESLTVGHTEQPHISRMTVVVDGTNTDVEQVVKQLYKLIDVLKVSDVTQDKSLLRALALVMVTAQS